MPTAPQSDPAPHPPVNRLAFMVRAFRHRNYRLFFCGQIISLCGAFLSQVAVVWLVYRLTDSAWVLGVTGFAAQLPMFALAPFGGVWVDRVNRHKLLVVTQVLSMLQSFALAGLALTHLINVPFVIALAFFQGVVNAFDMPGRQAFLVEMVEDRADLPNAIALNSTMVHAARMIGPAIGGILIYHIGEGWCFLLDGFSYFFVILALLAMRVSLRPRKPPRSVLIELGEGLRYVGGFAPIRVLLTVMAIISFAGLPSLSVLMPVFARFFGGAAHGSRTLGFLMTASGAGALAGAVYLASRRSVVGLGRVIAWAAGGLGVALIAFSFSRTEWISLSIIPFIGLAMIINFAAANTLLQTVTEEHLRGRVMSFFSMAFLGMAPFGNLAAGCAAWALGGRGADPIAGASWTILAAGGVCIAASVYFALQLPALRQLVYPIYERKGLLSPAAAAGLQTATEAVAAREG